MNVNDYTEKSLYAIQNAQNRALEEGNSIIDAEHLLFALLSDPDGLIPQILEKMKKDVSAMKTKRMKE